MNRRQNDPTWIGTAFGLLCCGLFVFSASARELVVGLIYEGVFAPMIDGVTSG